MHTSPVQHVSKNRLEGSLGDTPIQRLLDECHKNLVTGTVWVRAPGKMGRIELRAGAIDVAEFGPITEQKAAVEAMKKLPDGEYELVQRLPDLGGGLGKAAQADGNVSELPLVALMNHCEHNALSCTITIINDFDRGEIVYRAGELVEVTYNGQPDDDKIVELVRLTDAKFRVSAPPLDLGIEGWPAVRSDPTAPFRIDGAGEPRPPKRLARASEAPPIDEPAGAEPDAAPRKSRGLRLIVWLAGAAALAGAAYGLHRLANWWIDRL